MLVNLLRDGNIAMTQDKLRITGRDTEIFQDCSSSMTQVSELDSAE